MTMDCGLEIVDLKGDMRHRFHKLGNGGVVPVSLPLDAERIVLVITDSNFEVREWNFALEMAGGRNADMLEFISDPAVRPYLRNIARLAKAASVCFPPTPAITDPFQTLAIVRRKPTIQLAVQLALRLLPRLRAATNQGRAT